MESPSSARRVTRSQALSAASNNIPISRNKLEESEKGVSKSRRRNGTQQDRSALIDITNDSPIVGLAMGSLETPLSKLPKKMTYYNNTPGSGEALLRGQVKTLLQKVEEEAELSKISMENRPNFSLLRGLVNSPMGLLAPTPANTPHISGNESGNNNDLGSIMSSPVEEPFNFSQMVIEMFEGMKNQESVETEKNLITRSLIFDFSDKSEVGSVSSDSTSVMTYQGGSGGREKSSTDDDDSSIWSIQVNASTGEKEDNDEDEDVVVGLEEFEEDGENEDDYEGGEEGDGGLVDVDELCEGMNKICVTKAKFSGKHTRFVYNSDDEIEGEEVCNGESESSSLGILRLKGLPTPKGKHLRFPEEEEAED